MPTRRDPSLNPSQSRVATDDSSHGLPSLTPGDSNPYHPSPAFRRILNRGGNEPEGTLATSSMAPVSQANVVRRPALMQVIASAFVVGVVSGFLELLILVAQVHGLHYVDWSTLMISRHVAWMVPVVAPMLTLGLTIVLVFPALAWASWRGRSHEAGEKASWTWDWSVQSWEPCYSSARSLRSEGSTSHAPLAVSLGVGIRLRALDDPTIVRLATRIVSVRRNRRGRARDQSTLAMEGRRVEPGPGRTQTRRSRPEPPLDCHRYTASGSDEPVWV